jgi:hypothetical protein
MLWNLLEMPARVRFFHLRTGERERVIELSALEMLSQQIEISLQPKILFAKGVTGIVKFSWPSDLLYEKSKIELHPIKLHLKI